MSVARTLSRNKKTCANSRYLRHLSGALVFFLVFTSLSACDRSYVTISGQTMGTYYGVTYDPDQCQLTQQQVDAQLEAVNASMSTYLPDSELMRINHGDVGAYRVSAMLADVLAAAREINSTTDGAFDVSVGPLIELWGFGATEIDHPPDEVAQQRAQANIGQDLWRVQDNTLFKKRAGLALNLSAIAKGYAVDLVAQQLAHTGCSNFMVDIGGELKVAGTNAANKEWRLGIELPDAAQLGQTTAIVEIGAGAVATSGDYRNFQVLDGKRVHHIFDPRVGRPVQSQVVSATVVHPSAMIADGYATAFLVLPPRESLAIADAQGLAVYLIYYAGDADSTHESVYNAAMQQYLIE